ncbi:MAG TPA: DUF1467 family protein [Hyphomicrobiaceae bacterium]|nr:DUF1467 family protein [Hyphomicrobiaceae bacterium]
MSLTFGVAIYFIIWWLSLFAVLPFGLRTQDEAGEVVPGTPESAPARPRLLRIFMINTLVASIFFALFWLGVTQGWLDPETFPFQVPVHDLPRS